jgi:hypothetical protein
MTVRQERVDIVLHLGEDGNVADAEVGCGGGGAGGVGG